MKRTKQLSVNRLGKCLLSFLILIQFCGLYAQEVDQNRIKEIIARNTLLEGQNMAGLIVNGDISLLNKNIDTMSIARLDLNQLRILRNTIFAQYGYSFKSEDLKKHFSQFSWYSPKSINIDSHLSRLDLSNIKRIHKFEKSDTNSEPIIDSTNLVGIWHVSPHVAAGFHDVWQFYRSGRFTFNYSQMRELPRVLSFSGNYKTKGNVLLLNAESRKIMDHTDDIQLTGGWGYIWTNTRLETESFKRQFRFPISPIKTAGKTNKFKGASTDIKSRFIIEIGGIIYFKYSDDPDDYS